MVITRKIQIVVPSGIPEDEKKAYYKKLDEWRGLIRNAANMIVSHKFVQQNIRNFAYVQEDIIDRFVQENPEAKSSGGKIKFNVKDILKKEPGNSEQNVTYRVITSYLKGKCPSDFYTCLNQSVTSNYKKKIVDFLIGKASIPSYRNIPIPFPKDVLESIKVTDKDIENKETGEIQTFKDYSLDFYHVPLSLFFGKDKSGNRIIIDRALAGEYKFCSSSLLIDDDKKKMFLLVCVDIPQKEIKLDDKKILYAILDPEIPIKCSVNKKICTESLSKGVKWIGNKEEYLYRRMQIQAALKRLQISSKFNEGGRGRRKKLAIERFHKKEKNYIDTRMHLYSKMLVDEAVDKKCATIYLANYAQAIESTSKKDEVSKFLLRNWGYHGLITKIEYKAKKYGIKVIQNTPK